MPDFVPFFDTSWTPDYHCRPMSERLPVWIDPFRAADSRRAFAGRLDLATMARLAPNLADPAGEVEVELEFGVDRERVRYAQGRIATSLSLICQRCMQPMTVAVAREVKLAFVSGEGEMNRLDPSYEPVLVETETVALAGLVEDELLLALPMVAMHPEDRCQPAVVPETEPEVEEPKQEEKENPFSVLADLKKRSNS